MNANWTCIDFTLYVRFWLHRAATFLAWYPRDQVLSPKVSHYFSYFLPSPYSWYIFSFLTTCPFLVMCLVVFILLWCHLSSQFLLLQVTKNSLAHPHSSVIHHICAYVFVSGHNLYVFLRVFSLAWFCSCLCISELAEVSSRGLISLFTMTLWYLTGSQVLVEGGIEGFYIFKEYTVLIQTKPISKKILTTNSIKLILKQD